MPRMARVVIPGIAHHVTQRGNRGQEVFFTDGDRQRYLQLLLEYSTKHGLRIVAYCLMTNHVHLVCVPAAADSLAGAMKPVNLRYAQHVNWTQGFGGHVWQGRFFSCPLDDPHLWASIRYVERNPVRARLVRKAESYPWSSAAAHCGRRSDPLLCPLAATAGAPAASDWPAWLAEGDDAEILETLRLHTRTGRPAGDRGFVTGIEALVGRVLLAKPIGRPRKGQSHAAEATK